MLALLGGIVTIYSPSYRLRQYGSPRAFDPPPRVERALRGGCASFSFLLVDLSPLRWCSRSMSQVLSQPCTFYVIPAILTMMNRTWVANLAVRLYQTSLESRRT